MTSNLLKAPLMAAADLRAGPRNRDWLYAFAHQAPLRTQRSERYLREIETAGRAVTLDDLIDDNPRLDRYTLSRGGAALIGRSAFLYRTPGATQYQSSELLEKTVAALRAFEQRQGPAGDFNWGDHWSGRELPHHEHAWRAEPLLWARIWLENDLAESDRRWIDAMLARAGRRQLEFALERPNDVLQYCNRGAVWLTAVQLFGLYFEEPRYLKAVNQHADRILTNLIMPNGEVLENYLHYYGGGPDRGYSYTTWVYAMMFRLLWGQGHWDDRLKQGLRWLTHYSTHSGHPRVSGASCRKAGDHHCLEDLLPGYEFFADEEPWFDTLADRVIGKGTKHTNGHTVQPNLWALLCHRSRRAPRRAPAWFNDYEAHYEHQPSQYSLITHRYQTGVTYRGLFPLKGIQTFAYADEEPIVKHTDTLASGTRVGRVDTASTNVDGGLYGWEVFVRNAGAGNGYEPESPATVITTRRGKVWECYVFTPASAIYLVGSSAKDARFVTRWVLRATETSPARLDRRARRVTFAGREGCLRYLADRAALDASQASPILEASATRGPIVFGLGGANLKLDKLDRRAQRLRFSDASGQYELSFAKMFDAKGQLDRVVQWHRLTHEPAPANNGAAAKRKTPAAKVSVNGQRRTTRAART